jgi:hypothetical protein
MSENEKLGVAVLVIAAAIMAILFYLNIADYHRILNLQERVNVLENRKEIK